MSEELDQELDQEAEPISEPLHPDFQKALDKMQGDYGAKKGKNIFYAWVNKNKMDDTKARKGQKEEYPDELFAALVSEGIDMVGGMDEESEYDNYDHPGFVKEFKRSMAFRAKMKFIKSGALPSMPVLSERA